MLSHVVFVPVTLEVDPAFPERLPCFGNLIALKAKDLPGLEDSKWKGKHFDGFYILARVDPRWYKDDDQSEHYTCRLLSESELAVKVPSWDYDIMYNRDEVDDMTKESPPKWVVLDDHTIVVNSRSLCAHNFFKTILAPNLLHSSLVL